MLGKEDDFGEIWDIYLTSQAQTALTDQRGETEFWVLFQPQVIWRFRMIYVHSNYLARTILERTSIVSFLELK